MSERAKTPEIDPIDAQINALQARLSELQARKAEQKASTELAQDVFGVNDVTVPNEGEITSRDYFDQRSDGKGEVRRVNKNFFDENGKSISRAAYDTHLESTDPQDYYLQLAEGKSPTESYDALSITELAREKAKADKAGNVTLAKTIGALAQNHIMDAITDERNAVGKDPRYEGVGALAEGGQASREEEYKERLEQFDKWAERFGGHAVDFHESRLQKATRVTGEKLSGVIDTLKGAWQGGTALKKLFTWKTMQERWDKRPFTKGVSPDATPEVRDKTKNTTRRKWFAGSVALILAGGLALSGISSAQQTEKPAHSVSAAAPAEGDALGLVGQDQEATAQASVDQQKVKIGISDAPPAAEVATGQAAEKPAIHQDEGGIELFESVGLTADDWRNDSAYLLDHFQNDFYTMPNGTVGLTHTGLSDGAWNYINELKR